ncbi:MAG: hypothetical protein H6760_04845 [Candidatus Nomurabacteria bacterium]|nr:MAG: hypothetical protein H6760_04845 [Candidatus Nomurabacteria bacterium]
MIQLSDGLLERAQRAASSDPIASSDHFDVYALPPGELLNNYVLLLWKSDTERLSLSGITLPVEVEGRQGVLVDHSVITALNT